MPPGKRPRPSSCAGFAHRWSRNLSSAEGSSGFRGAREATPYAAQVTAENALNKAKTLHSLEKAIVYVKGIGAGREQAIRGIASASVDISAIFDITPVPHNGCRKKKVRKL